MATMEECRRALGKLSDNMQGAEGEVRAAAALDRSVSCHITDLDVTFIGRLTGGRIEVDDTLPGPPPDSVRGDPHRERAQIRLAMAGDDLVALVNGELNFATAWGSGRVRLEASLLDLFRLRKLL
ncbi:sterol-binding protein [Streptomyces sp. NPDC005890]|uniref:sterol-binding protein n=1 Tax=Streptomyces sp. NPDC005890 TaxID=3154568 RepID=UPI0033E5C112